MKIIAKNRGMGKTFDLIKRSAETGYPMIVATQQSINYIKPIAKQMGIDIPNPIKINDLDKLRNTNIDYVIIDQLDLLINNLLPNNIKVDTFSVDLEKVEIKSDENKKLSKDDLLNLLYDNYSAAIQKGDYGTALNIMKNIDMLSNQIERDK